MGFQSNFLFQNISNVFSAPQEVLDILQNFQPISEAKAKPIQRDHLPFLVLADDREKVEQGLDVRLALLGVAFAAGGVL